MPKRDTLPVMVAHNHPSGDLEPSKGDLDFTRRLSDLSEIAQICLLGHLIVITTRETSKSYCSIRELHQELFVVELVNKNVT